MLCVVIKGPSYWEAHAQVIEALKYADLIELRLDLFDSVDLDSLKRLRCDFSIPMIFTLKGEDRLGEIEKLAALKPEYLDLEYSLSFEFIHKISITHPEIKIILSYHNFIETPENLEQIYQEMKKISADYYKIAVMSQNCLDTIRLINWAKKSDSKLTVIGMGVDGQITRILSPIIGNPLTYSSIDEERESAPGQLPAQILEKRYHYHQLTPKTKVYGLLGDPVTQSISDETHNAFIVSHGLDAVYVKIQVKPYELASFLKHAKNSCFKGFSVTMPLKEIVMPLLDFIDAEAIEIEAVNTLVVEEGKISGFNTDGRGALNAIERYESVLGKRMVILGAGGASKAIAFEAHKRGANVTVVNRDIDKANKIARRLNCSSKALVDIASCIEEGYEILVNCTCVAMPISSKYILPNTLVMDLTVKPKETTFLKEASLRGCRIISGVEMFFEQANGQFIYWFKHE